MRALTVVTAVFVEEGCPLDNELKSAPFGPWLVKPRFIGGFNVVRYKADAGVRRQAGERAWTYSSPDGPVIYHSRRSAQREADWLNAFGGDGRT